MEERQLTFNQSWKGQKATVGTQREKGGKEFERRSIIDILKIVAWHPSI